MHCLLLRTTPRLHRGTVQASVNLMLLLLVQRSMDRVVGLTSIRRMRVRRVYARREDARHKLRSIHRKLTFVLLLLMVVLLLLLQMGTERHSHWGT